METTDSITISMQSDPTKNTENVLDYIKSEDFDKVSDNIKPDIPTFIQFLNWYYKTNWENLAIKDISYCMNMFNTIIRKSNHFDLSLLNNNTHFNVRIDCFYIAYLKCCIKNIQSHDISLDKFHETVWLFMKKCSTPKELIEKYIIFLKKKIEILQKYNQETYPNLTIEQTYCSPFPYELIISKTKNKEENFENTIEIEYDTDLIVDDLFQKINLTRDKLNHPDLAKAYTILKKRKISNDMESLSLYDALALVINYILVKKEYKVDESFWDKWNTALLDYFEKIELHYPITEDTIESYCSLLTGDKSKSLIIKSTFQSKLDVFKQSLDQKNSYYITNEGNNLEALDDNENIPLMETPSFVDCLLESVKKFFASLYNWILNSLYGTISE